MRHETGAHGTGQGACGAVTAVVTAATALPESRPSAPGAPGAAPTRSSARWQVNGEPGCAAGTAAGEGTTRAGGSNKTNGRRDKLLLSSVEDYERNPGDPSGRFAILSLPLLSRIVTAWPCRRQSAFGLNVRTEVARQTLPNSGQARPTD